MTSRKPLTKQDLAEVFKDLPTKDDVRQIVGEEISSKGVATKEYVGEGIDAILAGVEKMFGEQDKRNEKKFATKEDLKREAGFLKDEINGLKADLSNTPSRREFEELKARVDKYHPLS